MKLDLDRRDIISLLRGTEPDLRDLGKIPDDLGHYVGGFDDRWYWYANFMINNTDHTNEELYQIYLLCKNRLNQNELWGI